MPPVPSSRAAERRGASALGRLVAASPAWIRVGGQAAAVGRLLLLFTGGVVVAGALVLHETTTELLALAMTSGAMLVVVGLSMVVPWSRRPGSTVAFPVAVLAGLTALGVLSGRVATAYVGLIPLCFVYLGLFHRGRAALATVPLAWAAYLAMVPGFTDRTAVRLAVSGLTWWAIAQVLALAVAHQRDVRRRLWTDAHTDALTSLANRRDLDARLARITPGDCVVIVDLDHFKQLNDARGHAAGDAVLERFGQLVDQHLRRRDYAARYGGEEFVLVLPRTEPVQAVNMLRALRTEWLEGDPGVTFSAGVAKVMPGVPVGSALAAADIALYRAKNAGRDRFRIAPSPLPLHHGGTVLPGHGTTDANRPGDGAQRGPAPQPDTSGAAVAASCPE